MRHQNIQRRFTLSVLLLAGVDLVRLIFARSPVRMAVLAWTGIDVFGQGTIGVGTKKYMHVVAIVVKL